MTISPLHRKIYITEKFLRGMLSESQINCKSKIVRLLIKSMNLIFRLFTLCRLYVCYVCLCVCVCVVRARDIFYLIHIQKVKKWITKDLFLCIIYLFLRTLQLL